MLSLKLEMVLACWNFTQDLYNQLRMVLYNVALFLNKSSKTFKNYIYFFLEISINIVDLIKIPLVKVHFEVSQLTKSDKYEKKKFCF